VAISNALKRHAGPVSVWIDGIAASAASYVAMAGDEVVMPENAFLMIHDPSGLVMGTAEDMRAMAGALDKIKGSLIAGYAAKSGGAEDDIAALMAKETWLDAAEAVELGFADRLAEPVRIAACFDVGRFRNAPPVLLEAVESSAGEAAEDGGEDGAAETAETGATADDPTGGDSRHRRLRRPALPRAVGPRDVDAGPCGDPRRGAGACGRGDRPLRARRTAAAGPPVPGDGRQPRRLRTTLLATRADATPEVTALHPQPGRPAGAQPWGEVIARTFKRER
jgi:enoyl-CoA hydratase/carnithine racemase